jgi:hypothetical protein
VLMYVMVREESLPMCYSKSCKWMGKNKIVELIDLVDNVAILDW